MLEISNTIKSVLQWVFYISAIAISIATLVLFIEAIFVVKNENRTTKRRKAKILFVLLVLSLVGMILSICSNKELIAIGLFLIYISCFEHLI
jgi:membrane-associated HD superfamily phosphohydrolase